MRKKMAEYNGKVYLGITFFFTLSHNSLSSTPSHAFSSNRGRRLSSINQPVKGVWYDHQSNSLWRGSRDDFQYFTSCAHIQTHNFPHPFYVLQRVSFINIHSNRTVHRDKRLFPVTKRLNLIIETHLPDFLWFFKDYTLFVQICFHTSIFTKTKFIISVFYTWDWI